jgi:hypothetical protein
MQKARTNDPAYIIFTSVLSHFPSKICEPKILDFRYVTQHKGAAVYKQATKGDNATKHSTLSQKSKYRTSSLQHICLLTFAFFATRSVF